jgi:hypothetical protein
MRFAGLMPCASSTSGQSGVNLLNMQRRHQAIPLHQAAQESPTFAHLSELIRASSDRLQAIRSLLPAPLRASVQAGPMDEGSWCLLVSSNAVAAKLRQLLPALQSHLSQHGLPVTSIRIKVQNRLG